MAANPGFTLAFFATRKEADDFRPSLEEFARARDAQGRRRRVRSTERDGASPQQPDSARTLSLHRAEPRCAAEGNGPRGAQRQELS